MIKDSSDLKIVKVNPREVMKRVPAYRGSFRTVEKKETVHDLEIHNKHTGEPLFSLKPKRYGKGYDIHWHETQEQMHPGISDSFEHGSRQYGAHNGPLSADSRDTALYRAHDAYVKAARSGFRDRLSHKIVTGKDSEGNVTRETHFHDPDSGEKIGHSDDYGNFKFSGAYADAHGIDRGVIKTKLAKTNGGYERALAIHAEKGKNYTMHGSTSHVAMTSGPGGYRPVYNSPVARTYAAAPGRSDEEMSSAHESHIRANRRTAFESGGATLVRHSPTHFTAEIGDEYHSSLAHGGRLIHQSFHKSGGSALSHNL